MLSKLLGLFLTLAFSLSFNVSLAASTEESVLLSLKEQRLLQFFKSHPDFALDHPQDGMIEVYGPKGLKQFLTRNGVTFQNLPQVDPQVSVAYPSYQQITAELQALAKAYPEILSLFSIGQSGEGRELWVMKISDNVLEDESQPEFKYIANMHGDEIAGRELMLRLIRDLAESYKKDHRITQLINTTEIFIMPSMNPDGAERRWRGNAKFFDLNRSFPDFTTSDNVNSPQGRPPETQAVMRWQASRNFRLSANFHGGAEVINYPWDTKREDFPQKDLIVGLSLDYARSAAYIGASKQFANGIVNGYEWYEVDGGMQDWSYFWHNDLQITVELSKAKWPNYNLISYYYKQNREALIAYIEAAHQL